jgi:hypothetical protein
MPDDDHTDEQSDEARGPAPSERLRSIGATLTIRDVLTILVALALVVGLAGVVYVALTPQQATDPYTEFYILGSGGNASKYPTNLTVGERATVTVGVVNHEGRPTTYTLLVRTENRTLDTRTLTVDHDRRWENPVSYSFDDPGRVRVQFLLYRGDDPDLDAAPYRRLRLWTNVSAPPSAVRARPESPRSVRPADSLIDGRTDTRRVSSLMSVPSASKGRVTPSRRLPATGRGRTP